MADKNNHNKLNPFTKHFVYLYIGNIKNSVQ
jgi:hypothetical protein